MKNNYGKLTKRKVVELLYKYDKCFSITAHKILDIEIFKEEGKTDCAQILTKSAVGVERYFISCYGIIVRCLEDPKMKNHLITNENPFIDYDKKEVHLTTNEHSFIDVGGKNE